jgi:hypothetical protein
VLLTVSPLAAKDKPQPTVRGVRDRSAAKNAIAEPVALAVRERGLLARYAFDAVKDGQVLDAGPGGHHGTLKGGAAVEKLEGGNAVLRLDGTDGRVECPASVDLKTSRFTVCAWVEKPDAACRIVVAKGNGFVKSEWSLGWVWPGTSANISFRAGNRFIASKPNTVPAGKWVHVAFVRDGDAGTIYINGSPSSHEKGLGDEAWSNPKPLRIGRRELDRSPARFRGRIDDVRLYARALRPQEVAALARLRPE